MSETETVALTCDMVQGCTEPVSYLDEKGYIYCTGHGLVRQRYRRCRKLRPNELRKLQRGQTITRY